MALLSALRAMAPSSVAILGQPQFPQGFGGGGWCRVGIEHCWRTVLYRVCRQWHAHGYSRCKRDGFFRRFRRGLFRLERRGADRRRRLNWTNSSGLYVGSTAAPRRSQLPAALLRAPQVISDQRDLAAGNRRGPWKFSCRRRRSGCTSQTAAKFAFLPGRTS